MNKNEFIDTYSDDLLYLHHMREATLTHPFKVTVPHLFSSSFTRIYCVFMIGNIESMIEEWNDRNKNSILDEYIKQNNGNNESKIKKLYTAFVNNGIDVDEEILNDYLAIKYLRNTITHSGWKKYQKEFLKKRNFPTDSRELNDTHLKRMTEVNEGMMSYVAMTSEFFSRKEIPKTNLQEIRTSLELVNFDGILYRKKLPGLILSNLNKIKYGIEIIMEKTQDIKNPEIMALSEEAMFFWNLYKEHALTNELKSRELILASKRILKDLTNGESYTKIPIGTINIKALYSELNENEELEEQLKTIFEHEVKYSSKEILKAIIVGKEVYERFYGSATILHLFVNYLPQTLSRKSEFIISEAREILSLYELSVYYYNYVEKNSDNTSFEIDVHIYEEKLKELGAPFHTHD